MNLVKGIIFGDDMRNGLCWSVLLQLAFLITGHSVPFGFMHQLVVIGVTVLAAHLPDLDLAPYKFVRKNNTKLVDVLGLTCIVACNVLGAWLHARSFFLLAMVGCVGIWVVHATQDKVRERASHWPIWHHPIPVVAITALLTFAFAWDFDFKHLWFWELLTVPLVVAHFLHDSVQPQGFAILSPFTNDHYEWQVFGFEKVPKSFVQNHYRKQAEAAQSRSSKADLESRTDKVTRQRVRNFLVTAAAAAAMLLWLSITSAHHLGARYFLIGTMI